MVSVSRVGIQAVIFDWGGTLTPWHTVDLSEGWRRYLAAAGVEDADGVRATAMTEAEAAAWALSKDVHRATTLADLLAGVGVEDHDAGMTAYRESWDPYTILDPDALELFAGLAARDIRIGVLSNTLWPRAWHEEIFARDGAAEFIDGAVYSSELPVTKPHPDAFAAALAAVGATDPGSCIFVGDRLFDDVHGAQRVGMKAIHVPHSEIPTAQLVDLPVTPDAVVDRLGEVLQIVDGWAAAP